MNLTEKLGRFIESSGSSYMPEAAAHLLELLESDEVEPLDQPGTSMSAEEMAERLENRLERVRKRAELNLQGIGLIEDAVAHLRANDGAEVAPWTFEDSEGIRWFVVADDDGIIACYTSQPFIEADI